MFRRADGLSDKELADFDIEKDLMLVRSGATAYGTIVFGKIRIPAIKEGGEGYIHVRCVPRVCSDRVLLAHRAYRIHDPPNRVCPSSLNSHSDQ